MYKIAITSGKGGVGKTLVATSLALSLGDVHLLDADVDEPNCHIFLPIETKSVDTAYIKVPTIDKERCTLCSECSNNCEFHALAKMLDEIMIFENMCHGCGLCTTLCPVQAITERERKIGEIFEGKNGEFLFHFGRLNVGEELTTPVISTLKNQINHYKKEVVILDSPPGSACPVVETVHDVDFVLIVAEPTPFGFSDMQIIVETLKVLQKKFAVIINKDGIGNDELETFCIKKDIPILLKIPFDLNIAYEYSKGKTLVTSFPQWKQEFQQLLPKIIRSLEND